MPSKHPIRQFSTQQVIATPSNHQTQLAVDKRGVVEYLDYIKMDIEEKI